MTATAANDHAADPLPGLALVAAGIYGALLWVVATPYAGIYHDAMIYAVLVARWLRPAAFERELFFQFGSQDDYSLFTPLYGSIATIVGLDGAAKAVVALGGVLWIGGCVAVARALFGRTWIAILALLACAALKFSYSPNSVTFTYNENFATARSLALPLGLLALAALVAGMKFRFLGLAVLSTLLHPLHGIWLLALAVAMKIRSSWLAIAAATLMLLPWAGMHAGVTWLAPMDPDWLGIVRASTRDVLSGGLGHLRLGDILATIGILWLAARLGSPHLRGFYAALAWLTGTAVAVFHIYSEVVPIALVLQVQPWRVLWLAQLVALLAACDLLGLAVRRGRSVAVPAVLLLIAAWASEGLRATLPFAILGVRMWPGSRDFLTRLSRVLVRRDVLMGVGIAVCAALAPGYWLSLGMAGNSVATSLLPDQDELRGFLLGGGGGIAFLLAAALVRWRAGAALLLVVAGPTLAWEAWQWDRRSPGMRAQEARFLSVVPGKEWPGFPIRSGDVVAWPGQGWGTWMLLGTAAYATDLQSIGMVFSRQRTVEAARRLRRLSVAMRLPDVEGRPSENSVAEDLDAGMRIAGLDPRNLHHHGTGSLSIRGTIYLCTDPAVDWVIVPHRRVAASDGWSFDPGAFFGGRQFVHSCYAVRAKVGAGGTA